MADELKYVLGTAYEGYNSEVIVDTKKVNIEPGLVVAKKSDGTVEAVGSGTPYGVSGQDIYLVNTPVQVAGLKVCVQIAEGDTPAAIGTPAKADADGKINSSGTVDLGATIASGKVKGINSKTLQEVDAVLIDFPGSL